MNAVISSGINIFKAEFIAGFILTKRYWLNMAAGILNMFLFLVFIQLGIRSFGSGVSAEFMSAKMEMLIIGFFSFSIIGVGMGSITSRLSDNAATGILEQTMLSPIGVVPVLFFGVLTQFVFALVLYLLLIPLSMLLCSHFFSVNILHLTFFSVMLWLASCGIGFALSGLTLIYKKTQNFNNLIQFLILTLMVIPSYPFNVFSLLPVSPQVAILNKVIVSHQSVGSTWIIYTVLQSCIYFILGCAVFRVAEKYAKEKGIIGQY
ncbi:MAG: hypothetical protein HY746_08800 [Elusimicrobia bacterium]|nr:hypothetical protein [Elusimicrobiota bacterium]